jgi:hypothetical protein
MNTIDGIAAARRRYLESPRSRFDWVVYVDTVETLRREREGTAEPAPLS